MFEVVNNILLQISQLEQLNFSQFWNEQNQKSGDTLSKINFVYKNFLEGFKLQNHQLNFNILSFIWHSYWMHLSFVIYFYNSFVELPQSLAKVFLCHHQYFIQKLDMRNIKWAVYTWIMTGFNSNTKLFPLALVEIAPFFHTYKKVKE